MTTERLMEAMTYANDFLYWLRDSQNFDDYDLIVRQWSDYEPTLFRFTNRRDGFSWSMFVQ